MLTRVQASASFRVGATTDERQLGHATCRSQAFAPRSEKLLAHPLGKSSHSLRNSPRVNGARVEHTTSTATAPAWQPAQLTGISTCLMALVVLGVIAYFDRGTRSWPVVGVSAASVTIGVTVALGAALTAHAGHGARALNNQVEIAR